MLDLKQLVMASLLSVLADACCITSISAYQLCAASANYISQLVL